MSIKTTYETYSVQFRKSPPHQILHHSYSSWHDHRENLNCILLVSSHLFSKPIGEGQRGGTRSMQLSPHRPKSLTSLLWGIHHWWFHHRCRLGSQGGLEGTLHIDHRLPLPSRGLENVCNAWNHKQNQVALLENNMTMYVTSPLYTMDEFINSPWQSTPNSEHPGLSSK
jgi:hypothetical protein